MQLNIGNKIRELRRRDGRTQDALAETLGVSAQAVSRWESGGSYPDMEMIPTIANYFGITIDELFGYDNERSKKIDELVKKIEFMNFRNNGVDININECLSLAREALIEFPGNEKLMLSLASVLFNAGYVRYGEYHLIDDEGDDVYDVEQHRTYAEWKEAIVLYEKLLKTMAYGEERHRAVHQLTQLYLNIGDYERATEIIQTMPSLYDSREFLKAKATDGQRRTVAYGKALLEAVRACSDLMAATVLSYNQNMSPADKVQSLRGAIDIFGIVCTDGNCGRHHYFIARLYTLLSLYLWLDGRKDAAFEALDESLAQFNRFAAYCEAENGSYTAPLIRLVPYDMVQAKAYDNLHPHTSSMSLAEDWPWWSVPEYSLVKPEIQADPRWNEWVAKLQP